MEIEPDQDAVEEQGPEQPQQQQQQFERWSSHFEPEVTVTVCGKALTLRQQPSSDHVGQSVWDVARAMSKMFELGFLGKELKGHQRFIEVGAGLGLLSMAASMLGGRVVVTDVAEIVPFLQANVDANAAHLPGPGLSTSRGSLAVKELDWFNLATAQALNPPFNVILGTDVVYYPELVEPLVRTLAALSDEATQVVIVNERRSPRVHAMFFKAMTAEFKYQKLAMDQVGDLFDVSVFDGFIFRKKRKTV